VVKKCGNKVDLSQLNLPEEYYKLNETAKVTKLSSSLLLPPPNHSPKIDGPHNYRLNGPCHLTKAGTTSSERLHAGRLSATVKTAMSTGRTYLRKEMTERRKSEKQSKHLINIADCNDFTPYPKESVINEQYFVFCDGGCDATKAIEPPIVNGKSPRVISIRGKHLKVIDTHLASEDTGIIYKLDGKSSDVILPPRKSSFHALATKSNDAETLFMALEDIENHYSKSVRRGKSTQVVVLDNDDDGDSDSDNHIYICAGSTPKRNGVGISPYNVAFADSKPESQKRVLRLFKNVEYLFKEWMDTPEVRTVVDAKKLVNGSTFSTPCNDDKSEMYGAFASGKCIIVIVQILTYNSYI
jgi:hypothetical protein